MNVQVVDCVTLARILPPTQANMRTSVWCLMSPGWVAWCVSFFGVLLLCRPVEATSSPRVTIGGTGPTEGAKLKARTAVRGVFSNPTHRGHSEARFESGCGGWERLTDGGSDNGSKMIRADYAFTVEMRPVKPEQPSVS